MDDAFTPPYPEMTQEELDRYFEACARLFLLDEGDDEE